MSCAVNTAWDTFSDVPVEISEFRRIQLAVKQKGSGCSGLAIDIGRSVEPYL